MMISIMTFGKLCSGAKTLGREHSNGSLKMISKTLEWSAIPLMDFKKMSFKIRWDVYPGVGGRSFLEMTLVITKCSLRTINLCNHITLVWDGA
jgi:hypothetical protein